MKLYLMLFCLILIGSCTSSSLTTYNANQGLIKVLIVDGQNNHQIWPKATVMMKRHLESTGLFSVDVYRTKYIWRGEAQSTYLVAYNPEDAVLVDNPAIDEDFAPEFSNYDVIVSNFGYRAADWPRNTQLAFEDYMKKGGGFVSVHAANNAFPEWREYQKMTGLGGWGGRDEKDGPYVYFDDSGKLIRDFKKGKGGAHGTKHEFQIIKRNEHPIMADLPSKWMHTADECYGDLRGPAENMLVLASALCPIEEKGTGKHEPMLMVIEYGKGRVFHTTLGHQQSSYESVGFITTFVRGTQWAATGIVTIEVPNDFPSAQVSSARLFTK